MRGTTRKHGKFYTDFFPKTPRGVRGLDGSWGQSGFTLDVDAERVDRTHVSYLCPFCARAHRHGSGGGIRNRVEDRSTIGKHDESLAMHRKSLDIAEQAKGPGHVGVATSYINIAGKLESWGRYDEALSLYKNALAIRTEAFGPVTILINFCPKRSKVSSRPAVGGRPAPATLPGNCCGLSSPTRSPDGYPKGRKPDHFV